MIYRKICRGIFKDRPNRFIAHVEIDGKIETVHVKNTGRCKELLLPGVEVILEDFRERKEAQIRKTLFDLIAVYKTFPEEPAKSSLLINMDSQAPNRVVHEWLSAYGNDNSPAYDLIKPEYVYGDSRIDFYMEKLNSESGKTERFLMEVKGCTLEKNGTGYFPDAPTERGVKHLKELIKAQKAGFHCFLAFVIQIPGVKTVFPNIETHPAFGSALKEAEEAGVKILHLTCDVQEDSLEITSGRERGLGEPQEKG